MLLTNHTQEDRRRTYLVTPLNMELFCLGAGVSSCEREELLLVKPASDGVPVRTTGSADGILPFLMILLLGLCANHFGIAGLGPLVSRGDNRSGAALTSPSWRREECTMLAASDNLSAC